MPIPYVQECQESMSGVRTRKGEIQDAIDEIRGLADDQTWSGTPADTWKTDLEGHLRAAETSLGQPLDDAIQQCIAHAQHLQTQSAQQAANAGSTP